MRTTEEPRLDAWWRDATCAQVGIDLFFVNTGDPANEAKRVCKQMCPVRDKCLADAITTDIEYGIFGGTGRLERKRLVRRVERGEDPLFVAWDYIYSETRRAAS